MSSAPAVAAGGAEPSQQQTGARTQSWEEPHPGVPFPLQDESDMQALVRTPSGGWRGDMAAKGYGYFRTRSGVARRSVRPGLRPRMTRSTRIIQQTGLEDTDSETDYTTRGNETAQEPQTPSPAESTACPTPVIITADGEVNGDADMSGPETPPACDCRPLSLDISDFSHHITKTLDGVHSNASSLTVCDVESFTRAAPEEDLYGWDAGLKRKLEKGCGSTVVCTCLVRAHIPRRRHPSQKRNLLQRVFSGLGESRPRATE
ncbi:hypothetical protein GE09DRAFT_1210372 [Coniochaeta sp. 2T2.1]|nr:hypothetical protein GE09DRAFT_1210372 [Coniochaeta sp. 2T2.1]